MREYLVELDTRIEGGVIVSGSKSKVLQEGMDTFQGKNLEDMTDDELEAYRDLLLLNQQQGS